MRFRDLVGGKVAAHKTPKRSKFATAFVNPKSGIGPNEDLSNRYESLENTKPKKRRADGLRLDQLEKMSSKELRKLKRQLALELHPDRLLVAAKREDESRLAAFNSEIDRILATRRSRP